MLKFTHLLVEAKSKYSPQLKPYLETHDILDSIEAYSNIELNYHSMFPPIRIKTRPSIFILKRKRNLLYYSSSNTYQDQFIMDENMGLKQGGTRSIINNSEITINDLLEDSEEDEEIYRANTESTEEVDSTEYNSEENSEQEDEIGSQISEEQEPQIPLKSFSKLNTVQNMNEDKQETLQIKSEQTKASLKKTVEKKIDQVKSSESDGTLKTKNSNHESHSFEQSKAKKIIVEMPKKPSVAQKVINEKKSKQSEELETNKIEYASPEPDVETGIKKDKKSVDLKSAVKKVLNKNQAVSEDSLVKKPAETEKVEKEMKVKQEEANNKIKSNRIKDVVKKLIQEKKEESRTKDGDPPNNEIKQDSKEESTNKIKSIKSKKVKIEQKSSLLESDSAVDKQNQKNEIVNVQETIGSIIELFKEFENDLVSDDAQALNTWIENKTQSMDDNKSNIKKMTTSAKEDTHKDPRESLKGILELYRELENELASEEDSISEDIDDIEKSYMDKPISETLLRFNEALKNLMRNRKMKMNKFVSDGDVNKQQKSQQKSKTNKLPKIEL